MRSCINLTPPGRTIRSSLDCPHCRRWNPPEARFCNACGHRLKGSPCACGHINPPSSLFCHKCGRQIDALPGAKAATRSRNSRPKRKANAAKTVGLVLAAVVVGVVFVALVGRLMVQPRSTSERSNRDVPAATMTRSEPETKPETTSTAADKCPNGTAWNGVGCISRSLSGAAATRTVKPGIGVSRGRVQGLFEKAEIGFRFEEGALVDGEPRIMGKSRDGLALLELIGPPANLTSATIVAGIPNDSPKAVLLNSVYIAGLMKAVAPGWNESVTWLTDNVPRAIADGEATTTQGNLHISLKVIKALGMVSLNISSS